MDVITILGIIWVCVYCTSCCVLLHDMKYDNVKVYKASKIKFPNMNGSRSIEPLISDIELGESYLDTDKYNSDHDDVPYWVKH